MMDVAEQKLAAERLAQCTRESSTFEEWILRCRADETASKYMDELSCLFSDLELYVVMKERIEEASCRKSCCQCR